MAKTGLGKGLSALIPLAGEANEQEKVTEVEISKIKPNAYQPRRVFDQEKLAELSQSIKEHGVVQPIMLRQLPGGKYELVVGERRLRASELLGKETIPAVIKDLSDAQMMEIALVENIQREDLNPIEEAYAYKRLLEEFKLTQEQLAKRVSKSRPFIANMVRILNLPMGIIQDVEENRLTVGHARTLLSIENDQTKQEVAQIVINKKMSVRETETLVKKILEDTNNKATSSNKEEKTKRLPPVLKDLESKLRSLCGTKVKIKDLDGKGKIEIDYYNADDLDRISALLLRGEEI